MYLRDLPGTTLIDLADQVDQKLTTWGGGAHEITLHLEDDEPTLSLGGTDVVAARSGMMALASFFEIPPKFFDRLEKDEKQWLLNSRMEYTGGDLTVRHGDNGIVEVFKPSTVRVDPVSLVERALRVFPAEAQIVDWWCDATDLQVDVIVPEGFEQHIGGDPAVGDLTRGGVRFGQDRKNNTAPWVQPFLYRLVCTNGMEVPDLGLKVNARNASAEEIEAQFESEMRRAVDKLEADIHAFYDLRSQKVGDDPTGAMRRAAKERNLPERTVSRLLGTSLGNDPSMFDIANAMTNLANDPSFGVRTSSRRNLQTAGGGLVVDHARRCNTCHSRLGA
jgi:hypothetical protein